MKPSTPEEIAAVSAFIKRVRDSVLDLYFRWQDEKQFEDFQDYAKAFKSWLPAEFSFVKATKSPFGFQFQNARGLVYSFTVNSKQTAWKRVA
jgi:hypothetical protein